MSGFATQLTDLEISLLDPSQRIAELERENVKLRRQLDDAIRRLLPLELAQDLIRR